MRVYEVTIILKPQLSDIEVSDFLEKTKKFMTQENAETLIEDRWGRRKLSHPIGRDKDGFYVYLKFKSPPQAVDKMERHFKVNDLVLRALFVKVSEQEAAKTPAKSS